MSNPKTQIRVIHDLSDLEMLKDDWSRLAAGDCMRGWQWHQSWWKGFRCKYKPLILVASIDGKVVGILSLAEEFSLIYGKRMILAGVGKACGDGLGLMCEAGNRLDVIQAMSRWLIDSAGRRLWDSIEFDGFAANDHDTLEMLEQLRSEGGISLTFKETPDRWMIELPSSMDLYKSKLSKRTRRILKNLDHDLLCTKKATLSIAGSLQEMQGMREEIEKMHQSRWAKRDVQGCFTTPGFAPFLDDFTDRLWNENKCLVATLRIDGQTAAGAIGWVQNKTLSIYLVGMNIHFEQHRPGWMLNKLLIEEAIHRGWNRYDFLRGDEGYKERLGAKPSKQHCVIAVSPKLITRLRYATLRRGVQLRDWFAKPLTIPNETLLTKEASASECDS